jgi:hypothetical protein
MVVGELGTRPEAVTAKNLRGVVTYQLLHAVEDTIGLLLAGRNGWRGTHSRSAELKTEVAGDERRSQERQILIHRIRRLGRTA